MNLRQLIDLNIYDHDDVKRVIKNCDHVINLVGILYENRRQKKN